jgi:hypothetical protein
MALMVPAIKLGLSAGELAYVGQMLNDSQPKIRQALRSAVSETLNFGRTLIGRRIREHLNLKAGDVRKAIKISKRPSGSNVDGIISLDYQPMALAKFGARYTRSKGTTVTIVKDRGPQTFAKMFKASMASGHTGIFQRIKNEPKRRAQRGSYANRLIKRGPRKGQPILRQPIKEGYGVAVMRAFEMAPGMEAEILAEMQQKLRERVRSKIDWILSKQSAAPESSNG